MSEEVYLDNHSATKPFPEVVELFTRFSEQYWGDPSSPHFMGQQQIYPRQKALAEIAKVMGVEEDSIVFNHGKEEGQQQALRSTYLDVTRETGKTLFLKAEGETSSSLERLEQLGCVVKSVPLNEKGQVTKEALLSVITSKTAMLSLSWVNRLTGVIQPVSDLAEVCKEKGVLFHLDASYILGKRFFRFQDLDVDFLTVDGGLIHALPETGFMLVKKQTASSMTSVPSISALSYAVQEVEAKFEHNCMEVARLRDLLEEGIIEKVLGAKVLYKEADRVPNCTAISFPGGYAEALLFLLNSKGVYATIHEDTSLSFALSSETEEEEVERAIEEIVSSALHLQSVSKEVLS